MTISARKVTFDETTMWVELNDGRIVGVPLAWFPRLLRASDTDRRDCELSKRGIHWDSLDEDISIDGLLSAVHEAQNIILDQRVFVLDDARYQEFIRQLEAPAQNAGGRQRLMDVKPEWK